MAVAAFVGVLTFGLLLGVMIGAVISLVQLVRASSQGRTLLCSDEFPARAVSRIANGMQDNELIPGRNDFPAGIGPRLFQRGQCLRCDPEPRSRRADAAEAGSARSFRRSHTLTCKVPTRLRAWLTNSPQSVSNSKRLKPRSSVRDRLRHEGVDSKLGGVNRFTTVADVIDHFQRGRNASPLQPNEPHPTE